MDLNEQVLQVWEDDGGAIASDSSGLSLEWLLAELYSVRMVIGRPLQMAGIADRQIELALGITMHPGDRQGRLVRWYRRLAVLFGVFRHFRRNPR